MRVYKRRDLTILEDGAKSFVIACDSCGGIGQKRGDVFSLSPRYVGMFTARVAMMEVLSSGASPCLVANGVCNEMHPTAALVIEGVEEETRKVHLPKEAITGSTEENFATSMTGLGLMAMGSVATKKLLFKRARQGDLLILCGLPKVGAEIMLPYDPDLICYEDVSRWVEWKGTREIALCGSKGIEFECRELALLNGCRVQMSEVSIDVRK